MEKENKKNLFQKLDLARVKIGAVNKNLQIQSYKAVSETDILKAVNEAEHEVGLVSYQESLEIISATEPGQGGNIVRVKVGVRVVNIDNPSESVVFYGLGDGIDRGDKACGKAVTYAVKYALIKGYKIPTGEDDPDYFSNAKNEPMATEEDIATYINLIGGEKNIPSVCKKLGVKNLADLTQAKIRERIEIRQNAIMEEEAKKVAKRNEEEIRKINEDFNNVN